VRHSVPRQAKTGDKWLLLFGIVGVALAFIVGIFLACPTIRQQWHQTILFALAAAALGAAIPGILKLQLEIPGNKGAIQAGGGLAIFVIVYYLNPAGMGSDRGDQAFSNASCQRVNPTGFAVSKTSVSEDVLPEKVGAISSAVSLGRPVEFAFNYGFGEYAGLRKWTQVKPGVWSEVYPNPAIITVFTERGRDQVGKCLGTRVAAADSRNLEIFIPDLDCADKTLFWRAGADPQWQVLGPMKDAR
jgi:hypothetical protein